MGGELKPKKKQAGARRTRTAAFYEIILAKAVEIGEVARIETEIQKAFPPATPQPRCPDWHILSPHHLRGHHHRNSLRAPAGLKGPR
ncbi:MAG TPA: hypothetical protein VLZ74_05795 [Methylocella sp.]|nr:hypothetical protein [Methylocella sp.]